MQLNFLPINTVLDYTESFQKRCWSFPAVKLLLKSSSTCLCTQCCFLWTEADNLHVLCSLFRTLAYAQWHCINQDTGASAGFPNAVRWFTMLWWCISHCWFIFCSAILIIGHGKKSLLTITMYAMHKTQFTATGEHCILDYLPVNCRQCLWLQSWNEGRNRNLPFSVPRYSSTLQCHDEILITSIRTGLNVEWMINYLALG